MTAARHTHLVSSKQSGMDTQPFQFAGEKLRNYSVLNIVLDLYVPGSLSPGGYDGPRLLHDC